MSTLPTSKEELAALVRTANEQRSPLSAPDLQRLNRVLEHTPEDMTVTVEAGCRFDTLQAQLAQRGQWLPLDPPHADQLTIADVIARNPSGPRRFGFGTIRDHLIGLQVVLADGRLVRNGGKVVKNVAGFDLLKLFVGAEHSLGFVVEATFKLLPRPETECFVRARCDSLAEARVRLASILDSPITPSVLDLHNNPQHGGLFSVVAGFSGSFAEVDWQLGLAAELGFAEPTMLDYEQRFWELDSAPPRRWSVPPATVVDRLLELDGAPFVARAGNGTIYFRGEVNPPRPALPSDLLRRVKETFDPHGILPAAPVS
jgi:FAD/FMN-containing dehydrogenase